MKLHYKKSDDLVVKEVFESICAAILSNKCEIEEIYNLNFEEVYSDLFIWYIEDEKPNELSEYLEFYRVPCKKYACFYEEADNSYEMSVIFLMVDMENRLDTSVKYGTEENIINRISEHLGHFPSAKRIFISTEKPRSANSKTWTEKEIINKYNI